MRSVVIATIASVTPQDPNFGMTPGVIAGNKCCSDENRLGLCLRCGGVAVAYFYQWW